MPRNPHRRTKCNSCGARKAKGEQEGAGAGADRQQHGETSGDSSVPDSNLEALKVILGRATRGNPWEFGRTTPPPR